MILPQISETKIPPIEPDIFLNDIVETPAGTAIVAGWNIVLEGENKGQITAYVVSHLVTGALYMIPVDQARVMF